MSDTNNTAAAKPAETKQDRINTIVGAALDAILDTVTHPEVVAIQANPSGIWTRLKADLNRFAGNLVSASTAEQPPQPQQFHRAFGIEQREPRPQAIDVAGLMRTLGADATEH